MKNWSVDKINFNQAKPFLLNIHYARRLPCIQYAFGLFIDGNLKGVITYGQPPSPPLCKGVAGEENRHRVIELNRLVLEINEKNAASFLVGRSLKMLPKNLFVVSFADTAWGHHGYVYQATNFLYTGLSAKRTDVKMTNGAHPRHQKHADRSQRQKRSQKHRYIYLTGDKTKQLKELKYPTLPYPKGTNQYYDPKNPKTLSLEHPPKYHQLTLNI